MKKIFLLAGIAVTLLLSGCTEKQDITKDCCRKTQKTTASIIPISQGSLYTAEGNWTDQDGQSIRLTDLSGRVQVVAMIFTNCAYACPRTVSDLKAIEAKLNAAQKDRVDFLLISFDTERDNPARLKQFASEMKLNNNHWKLLHGNEEQVREISMLLDVKYEKQPDGSFAHSNVINVLNPEGETIYKLEGLGESNEEALDKINALLVNE